MLTFYLHDSVIVLSSSDQTAIQAEYRYRILKNSNRLYDSKDTQEQLENNCVAYINEKSIISKDIEVNVIKSGNNFKVVTNGNAKLTGLVSRLAGISTETVIKESNPPDYIRRVNALKQITADLQV